MPQKMQDAIVKAADSPSDDIREKFDEIYVVPTEKKTCIKSGGSVQTTVTRYSSITFRAVSRPHRLGKWAAAFGLSIKHSDGLL